MCACETPETRSIIFQTDRYRPRSFFLPTSYQIPKINQLRLYRDANYYRALVYRGILFYLKVRAARIYRGTLMKEAEGRYPSYSGSEALKKVKFTIRYVERKGKPSSPSYKLKPPGTANGFEHQMTRDKIKCLL